MERQIPKKYEDVWEAYTADGEYWATIIVEHPLEGDWHNMNESRELAMARCLKLKPFPEVIGSVKYMSEKQWKTELARLPLRIERWKRIQEGLRYKFIKVIER